LACALTLLAVVAVRISGQTQTTSTFASRIEQFSEPAGYFDTDNLISNERSYLHPLAALRQRGVSGGVYIGVGPDQSFSYIAHVHPTMAFIVDIRRDNMLLHLLFKALFALSRDRADYLSLLFGRPPPRGSDDWRRASIGRLVQHVDSVQPDAARVTATRQRVDHAILKLGLPLSRVDRDTIVRFHRTFIEGGLSLKFQSTGRPPREYYPSYRDLLLETDRSGHEGSYLASDELFQFVKSMQARDLIIPIVGNIAGDRALAAIGRFMAERGERLSVFYTSNVELYLTQNGSFPRFIANLEKLPYTERSVVIRSVFGRMTAESVPGYASTSVVQSLEQLVTGYASGRFPTYESLVYK
jgi:hypothetical protein